MLQGKELLDCFGRSFHWRGCSELAFQRYVPISGGLVGSSAAANFLCALKQPRLGARVFYSAYHLIRTRHCHASSTSPLSSKFDFFFSSSLS